MAASVGGALVSFAAGYLVVRQRSVGHLTAAFFGIGTAVMFAVVFALGRRQLRRSDAHGETLKEAFLLGLLVVAVAVAGVWFVVL